MCVLQGKLRPSYIIYFFLTDKQITDEKNMSPR